MANSIPSSQMTLMYFKLLSLITFSSVQFSCSVVSYSLRPHESQHARLPCPSTTPEVHSRAGAQNALGLLQSAPEATLCVCVCVCVCARARVLGSHGFWSSLKRLRPCWPGKQGACSRAATHFFPLLGLRKWRVSGMWTPLPSYSRCSKCSLLPPTLLSSAVLTRNDHLLRRTSNLPSPASKT